LLFFLSTIALVFCWRWLWHSVVVAGKFALRCRAEYRIRGEEEEEKKKKENKRKESTRQHD
jgi:hypothetical protein